MRPFEFDTSKYSIVTVTKECIILRSVTSTTDVVVWDHASIEVGKFSVGATEAVSFAGHKWIITLDATAKKYYFYYRDEMTYKKSEFTLDYEGTSTTERKMID
jgi:hypothetical protein